MIDPIHLDLDLKLNDIAVSGGVDVTLPDSLVKALLDAMAPKPLPTSEPEPAPPPSGRDYAGVGLATAGNRNLRIGFNERTVAVTLTPRISGILSWLWFWLKSTTTDSKYSLGTGGEITVSIITLVDLLGAGDWRKRRLAHVVINDPKRQEFWKVALSSSVRLEAGVTYAAVFENTDPDPAKNHVSLNLLTSALPVNAAPRSAGVRTLWNDTSTGGQWDDYHTPTVPYFAWSIDGTPDGYPFANSLVSSGKLRIESVPLVKETFAPSTTLTVNRFHVLARRLEGSAPLRAVLHHAGGVTPLGDASVPSGDYALHTFAFDEIELLDGVGHALTLVSDGVYETYPIVLNDETWAQEIVGQGTLTARKDAASAWATVRGGRARLHGWFDTADAR